MSDDNPNQTVDGILGPELVAELNGDKTLDRPVVNTQEDPPLPQGVDHMADLGVSLDLDAPEGTIQKGGQISSATQKVQKPSRYEEEGSSDVHAATWVGPRSDIDADESLMASFPSFPLASISDALSDSAHYIKCLPLWFDMLLVAIVTTVIAISVLATGSAQQGTAFIKNKTPLQAGPLGHEHYPAVAILERNEQVLIIEKTGDWALVRDPLLRVGYVPIDSLVGAIEPTTADHTFTRCRQRMLEGSAEDCLGRALAQEESCVAFCSTEGSGQGCLDTCESRSARCRESCTGKPIETGLSSATAVAVKVKEPSHFSPTNEPQIEARGTPKIQRQHKNKRKGKRSKKGRKNKKRRR